MNAPLPTLFLPHGAPDLAISDHPARDFLVGLADTLPSRPRGIVIVSAHWQASVPSVTASPAPPTVHDFSGFAPELQSLAYPARTDAALLDRLESAMAAGGMAPARDAERGFDHGAWVPLLLAWPEAEIPVVQLSLVRGWDADRHVALGRALVPLTRAGYLVVGSGASVHNLSGIGPEGSPPPSWATAFDGWLDTALVDEDPSVLVQPARSPSYRQAHPTPEHLMPLYVAYGAAGRAPQTTRLHDGYSYGSVGMSAWQFDATSMP